MSNDWFSQSFEFCLCNEKCFRNCKMINFIEANKKLQESVKRSKTISNIPDFIVPTNQASSLNFYHLVQPNHYASRIFGFVPFSFKFNTKHEVSGCKVKIRDFIWFLVSLFIYISLAFLGLYTLSVPNIEHSYILFVGNHVVVIFGLICGVFDIIFDMFNRNRLTDIILKINSFDKKVNSIRIWIYKYFYSVIFFGLFSVFTDESIWFLHGLQKIPKTYSVLLYQCNGFITYNEFANILLS